MSFLFIPSFLVTRGGIGFGDVLVGWILSFYFIETKFLTVFFIVLIISSIFLVMFYIYKQKLWKNKKEIFKLKMAYIPCLTSGFIGVMLYYIIINLI